MKWTLNWLKDYLKTEKTAAEIASKLNEIGLEIEEFGEVSAPIVAKITSVKKHPDSDHLNILTVDCGKGEDTQIVCGAPNVREGLIGVLAVPGCIIQGHEISVGKIRGVVSNGMMCSESELGISDNHDGIIDLESGEVGTPFNGVKDWVFEGSITPNFPHYLAVSGIARDLSAAGFGEFVERPEIDIKTLPEKSRSVEIIAKDLCDTYTATEIRNIKMSASNKEISSRLDAIGMAVKNACVDATNFMCFDVGQPMHVFDADKVNGAIKVRLAVSGEKLVALNGKDYLLTERDLVIADDEKILALAGIMGGMESAATDETKNIILESAHFDEVSIRKSSKFHGLSSDSSYRYERGVDPALAGTVFKRAVKIINDVCGGEICAPTIAGGAKNKDVKIKYNPDDFEKLMGAKIDEKTQAEILEKMGYTVNEDWEVGVPSFRFGIEIWQDLVFEIARIYGLSIVSGDSEIRLANRTEFKLSDELKSKLIGRGLSEVVTYGFSSSKKEQKVYDKKSIAIANPIVEDLDVARQGLIPNMLDLVAGLHSLNNNSVALFEVGTVFDGDTPNAEHNQLVVIRTGDNMPKDWQKRSRLVDIFDVKGDLISLVRDEIVDTSNPPKWAHPYRFGRFENGAEFGELHPNLVKFWKLKSPVVVAVMDLKEDFKEKFIKPEFSEFQKIYRDFAFVIKGETRAGDIVNAIKNSDTRIKSANVFDVFELSDGMKSIAINVEIQPNSAMSEKDLAEFQERAIAAAESLGATLRT